MRVTASIALLLVVALASTAAASDDEPVEVELASGEVVSGNLERFADGVYAVLSSGKSRRIDESLVREVRFLARSSPVAPSTVSPEARSPLPFRILDRARKGDWARFAARSSTGGRAAESCELDLLVADVSREAVSVRFEARIGAGRSARRALPKGASPDATVGAVLEACLACFEENRGKEAKYGELAARETKVDDRERVVAGRSFPCKRALFLDLHAKGGEAISGASSWDATAWLSPDARVASLVALSAEAVSKNGEARRVELELEACGPSGRAELGELPDELAFGTVEPETLEGAAPAARLAGEPIRAHDAAVERIALSRDGALVVTAARGALALREVGNGKLVRSLDVAGSVAALAFSARAVFFSDEEGAVSRWDLASGERASWDDASGARFLAVDSREDLVLGASRGELAFLRPGGRRETLPCHLGEVLALAVSSDGTRLASAGGDAVIRVTSLAERRRDSLLAAKGSRRKVLALAFSGDGKRIVAAFEDAVRFLDAESGELVRAVRLPRETTSLVLSADGSLALALSDGKARLLDLARARGGEPLDLSRAPYDRARAAVFSPDSRSFLMGTQNGLLLRFELTDR